MNDTLKTWLTFVFWVATSLILSARLTWHEWAAFPDWVGLLIVGGVLGAVLGARSAWRDL